MSSLKSICFKHVTEALNMALHTVEGSFTLDKVEGLIKTIDAIKEAVKHSFANLKKIQAAEDRLKNKVAGVRCPLFSSENEQQRVNSLVEYHRFLKQISEKLSSVSLDRFNPEELQEIKSRKDLLESYMAFVTKGRAVPGDFSKLKAPQELTSLTVEAFSQYLEDWVQILEAIEQKITEDQEAVSSQSPHTGTLVGVYTAYKDVLEHILQKEADPVRKNRSMLAYMPVNKMALGVIKAFSEHFDTLIAESKPSRLKIDLASLGLASQASGLNAAPEIVYQEEACLEALEFLRYPLHVVSQHARELPPLERLSARFPSLTEGNFRKMLVDRDWESSHLQKALEGGSANIYIGDSVRKEIRQGIRTGDAQKIRESLLYMFLDHPHILRPHTITNRNLFLERALHDMYACIYRKVECHHYQPLNMLHYLEGTAKAIQYLHGKGLIHKDIKPENILVFDDRLAKLGDFGGSGIAQDWLYACTPDCDAPEVTAKRSFSFASDVWSFGCVIYTTLTKRDKPSKPFFSDKDQGNLSVMDKTGGLRGVMEGCLAHDPSGRLSTDDVVHRLSRMLIGDIPTERAAADLSTLSIKN